MNSSFKPFLAILALVVILVGVSFLKGGWNRSAGAPVEGWATDIGDAQAQARSTGKPMLVYFTASWCPPCQQMKKKTLPDATVKQSLAKYVPVMIDIDQQPGVAQKFGVRSVPTFMAVEADGTVVKTGSGGMPAGAFVSWLDG
jgi:thioredoxin-like negative regulator of GroEL